MTTRQWTYLSPTSWEGVPPLYHYHYWQNECHTSRVVAMHGRECEGDTQSTQRITESSEENTETDLLEE